MLLFLFASALFVIPSISSNQWMKETVAFDDKRLKDAKESIEWSWMWGRTKAVPTGSYVLYKKGDKEWKPVLGRHRKEGGKCIDVYKWDDDFSITETYLIFGGNKDVDKDGNFVEGTEKSVKSSEQRWLAYTIVAIVIASVVLLMCVGCCCVCYIRKR